MADRKLHIISFDHPFPANYGGVIDVYHKIRALAQLGVEIHLHSFIKEGGPRTGEREDDLEDHCREIHRYSRITHWRKAVTTEPYIIRSRRSGELVRRLQEVRAPILLEGMHSMSVLDQNVHRSARTLLRMHNVEWDYYRGLADASGRFWKKAYFRIEAYRLKAQAAQLKLVDRILAISQNDQKALQPYNTHVDWLPPFHGLSPIVQPALPGDYALYHGNLAVEENRRAAEFLMDKVFPHLGVELIVAGQAPPREWLRRFAGKATFETDVTEARMDLLVREARCHVLPTFQATGVKLKLIHALYSGRPCIVNSAMVAGTGLAEACQVCDDPESMRQAVLSVKQDGTCDRDLKRRAAILEKDYNDLANAQKLISWLFEDWQ